MTDETVKLIVHHQWSKARIFVLALLVAGVGASVAATMTVQDLRSKAASILPSPTPLLASPALPSPRTQLESPYVRLVVPKTNYPFGASVPVDVYMTTGGTPTVEADIALSYNPDFLEIKKSDITVNDVYKSHSIVMDEDGKLQLVLFVDTQVGLAPVSIESEKQVAHLIFKTKALASDKAEIAIDYSKKDTQKTNLTENKEERSSKPVNLFDSVEGVTLKISP
jgi:hypothetical protein